MKNPVENPVERPPPGAPPPGGPARRPSSLLGVRGACQEPPSRSNLQQDFHSRKQYAVNAGIQEIYGDPRAEIRKEQNLRPPGDDDALHVLIEGFDLNRNSALCDEQQNRKGDPNAAVNFAIQRGNSLCRPALRDASECMKVKIVVYRHIKGVSDRG